MLSWPPATTTSLPSTTICFAAAAIAVSPEAHWRSIVCAPAVTGMPAAIAALRARFIPAVPAVSTEPTITSSTSAPSTPARMDGMADRVAHQRGRLDVVERTAERASDRRAGGGDDDGFPHGSFPFA